MNSETEPINNTGGKQHVCTDSRACVLPVLVPPALIVALTVFAYHRTLFNFFAGDDYCHLAWLAAAAKNPALTLSNFTGPWLGGVTTHFYRPLISLSLLFDYACWGNNAAAWHIDNLIQLLLSSFFLYCIFDSVSRLVADYLDAQALSELPRSNNGWLAARFWAVAAAGLFALYPLHPEAVSWIVGRVDSLSACFYLGSLCCYIFWRTGKRRRFLVLSLVSMAAGLLSKETVVTLPAVVIAFEIAFGNKDDTRNGSIASRAAKLLRAFKKTAPLWIVLICYAAVRRLALSTFVGGYDVSLSSGLSAFVQTSVHSLQMMLIPINHDFIGVHDWRAKLWGGFIIVSAASLIAALITNPRARPQFTFLFSWLVLSLLPVWNIFSISSQLQGARFGYLPSAPLCGLLLMGYFFFNANTIGTKLLRLCVPCFLLLSAYMLYINNEAWHAAGTELSAIEHSLANTLPHDCQVMLLNLPDSIHGAYACRNAADGILFKIGAVNDSAKCVAVSRCQGVFPTGFLKDSIAVNANKIAFLWWDRNLMKFDRINSVTVSTDTSATNAQQVMLPTRSKYSNSVPVPRNFLLKAGHTQKAHGAPHNTINANLAMQPVAAPGVIYNRLPDDSGLFIKSVKSGIRPCIDLPALSGKNCWDIDFIAANVLLLPGGTAGGACGMDLIYANTSNTRLGDLCYRAHADVANVAGKQKIIFALRGDEGWTFGGKAAGCALLLPDRCEMIVKDIQLVAAYQLIPRLAFTGGDYLHSKGFVGLNRRCVQKPLQYDATAILGAKGVRVEISKRNATFESANSSDEGNNVGRSFTVMKAKGVYVLKLNDFHAPGYYSLRVRAVDAAGNGIGPASDHIVVLVQK